MTWVIFLLVGVLCNSLTSADQILPFSFDPDEVNNVLNNATVVTAITSQCKIFDDPLTLKVTVGDNLITLSKTNLTKITNGSHCWDSFNVTGEIIGRATIRVQTEDGNKYSEDLKVIVVRETKVIDDVFVYCVAILVAIVYINFGCALDWEVLKKTIKRPIGPVIGFCCQFVFMPLIAFGLGKWIFPESPEMQLGLFFTGLSPAGGASNIWSVALEANVNLSITMTTISTIFAFAMFPFWLFTLGDVIFENADLASPYAKVSEYLFCLIVPLAFGLLSQKYLPKFARIMVRLLKPFSIFLILFIVIFACITNDYLFDLFTWKIAAAGIGLPWLGYLGGFIAAYACKQSMKDVLAIAVETGVQNTGIAIFMLRFSLDEPEADLTTVIPVAVSIMTPVPLLILFIVIKARNYLNGKQESAEENNVELKNVQENNNKGEEEFVSIDLNN